MLAQSASRSWKLTRCNCSGSRVGCYRETTIHMVCLNKPAAFLSKTLGQPNLRIGQDAPPGSFLSVNPIGKKKESVYEFIEPIQKEVCCSRLALPDAA